MAEKRPMTLQEELELGNEWYALRKAGRIEEARELGKQLPLPPHLADVYVKFLGKESLRNSGWNLYEVEKAYGADWINK